MGNKRSKDRKCPICDNYFDCPAEDCIASERRVHTYNKLDIDKKYYYGFTTKNEKER